MDTIGEGWVVGGSEAKCGCTRNKTNKKREKIKIFKSEKRGQN